MYILPSAPDTITAYKEIAVIYDKSLPAHFNSLSAPEKVFVWLMKRASAPGNRICADQLNRYALASKDIFLALYTQRSQLSPANVSGIDIKQFIDEVKTFVVYLWSQHSQYFARESAEEKRTPAQLNLSTLTRENLVAACRALGLDKQYPDYAACIDFITDGTRETTLTVANDIDTSAINFYAPAMTEQDYAALDQQDKTRLSAYFDVIIDADGNRIPQCHTLSTQGRYAKELTVAVHWLKKAHYHAAQHPEYFDQHLVKSLELLVTFLTTGDEEYFRQHSIEWLKNSSRIDYNFGFIETYHDPKSYRGLFQAEATIKTVDMQTLNELLPSIEQQLPLPDAFKRSFDGPTPPANPNASINTKIFGMGALGPMATTAAYCLPNYDDIRATYGSKQIIYPATPSIGQVLNPTLYRSLSFLRDDAQWMAEHDPEGRLFEDLWNIHCILHETLGHGSGKLAHHTFVQGDPLIIGNTQYQIGDIIPVTHENLPELLGGYDAAIEELRAEIIALYVSITHLDALVQRGLLADWHYRIGKARLVYWLMYDMAKTALRRIVQQNDAATQVTDAHGLANCTITNYLIHDGGMSLEEETCIVDGTTYTVLGLRINDIDQCVASTTRLMQLVQQVKSTGDGQQAASLIDIYGKPINHRHMAILKQNLKAVAGDLKAVAFIEPHLVPVHDNDGIVVDINASWPQDFFEQCTQYAALGLEKD